MDDSAVMLEVGDDGRGYPPDPTSGRFGLVGIRERAALLGGHLQAGASALGGACLRVILPLPCADSANLSGAG